MKSLLKTIFFPLFAVSCATATVSTHKTFLMPRPIIDNIAMEKAGWHEHIEHKMDDDFNFHFQTTFFHKASIKGEDVGKYFGIDGTNNFNVKPADSMQIAIARNDIDVWNRWLRHDYNGNSGTDKLEATINLNPKQEIYGVRLDLFGYLRWPFEKGFFKISTPIVHVENDLHVRFGCQTPDDCGKYISDFFRGAKATDCYCSSGICDVSDCVTNINSCDVCCNESENLQSPLTHAKMGNRRSKSGVADIDFEYGYRLVEKKKRHLYLSALLTIPTGNRVRGEWLFEPVYGNGRHVGLGWALDGSHRIWKRPRHQGTVLFALKHKYLFDGTEKRTIPLKSCSFPFSHYYLAGKMGQVGSPLFPLANVMTRNLRVRPGNLVDSMLALEFKTRRFLLNLGYNLFYKEREVASLKKCSLCCDDNVYAIAKENYNTENEFTINDALLGETIGIEDFDLQGATTPNQLTHKAFGHIGYRFNISRNPASIGVGGSYEFASNNHELEGYEFWFKCGITF